MFTLWNVKVPKNMKSFARQVLHEKVSAMDCSQRLISFVWSQKGLCFAGSRRTWPSFMGVPFCLLLLESVFQDSRVVIAHNIGCYMLEEFF